ncbi:hypothetical protein Ddc_06835 [Ditylenchus destructor]|nr:hypothetical protein Ddc_06835 [Ditylenchus destructor]
MFKGVGRNSVLYSQQRQFSFRLYWNGIVAATAVASNGNVQTFNLHTILFSGIVRGVSVPYQSSTSIRRFVNQPFAL